MSMQIHGPSDCLTAEDIHAFVNSPGFIVLNFGPVRFYLDDPQQCDWLIIAATEAKQLLIDNPAKPEDGKPADPPAPDDDDESGEDATVAIAESSEAERSSFVGRIVEDAHDDSPVPTTGRIVRQIDGETVEVQWDGTSSATREPIDALRPARKQAASVTA